MSSRLSGLLVLIGLIASLLFIWQPWRDASEARLNLGLDLKGGLRVVLQADVAEPTSEDLNAARSVIENRINAFGVAEPLIQTSGTNRIVVELPGLAAEDQERALDLIGQQAVLEFRLVRAEAQELSEMEMTPENLEPTAFTGEILSGAQAGFAQPGMNSVGGALVSFNIRNANAQAFGDFTASNMGRRMAIVLDGKVISAPTIQSRISTEGQITGMEGLEQASDLALVLRSGSLPISLTVEEIRAIGPTLGADSIRAGTIAGAIGGLAVILCVLLYYGPLFGGVLALGVIYAMLLIFGVLAGLRATLTLPGLAGLVLTIGAAVDGNVISFERIKEELRAGKGLRIAMKSGFQNSLSAIIDANVTTLFAAAALYQYTSGPVRGFATTLAIGIVASVFVNTVAVPFALNALTRRYKRDLMPRGFYASGIRFLGRAPVIMAVSGLLAAGSLFLVVTKGLTLSTDFTSGTSVLLSVPESTTVDEVRTVIDSLNLEGVSGSGATVQQIEGSQDQLISVRVGANDPDTGEQFARALGIALNAKVEQSEFVALRLEKICGKALG